VDIIETGVRSEVDLSSNI